MGGKTAPDEAERILDRYLASGGNLIDTADVYEDGGSERVLAPWLARHRSEVVVATKVRFEVSDPGGAGLAPDRIRAACDASLRRLGIDVIDLYQLHAPDPGVPVEESLEALEALVRAGKVRALGISNFPAWLTAWSVAVQDREGWTPFVALQAQYSLVERSIELELLPFCRAAGLGVLPWGPLGAGFLSGRYRRGEAPPEGSRIEEAQGDYEEAYERRAVERNFQVVDAAAEIAAAHGATIPQVAVAWLLGTDGVTAPVLGARTLEQLEELLPVLIVNQLLIDTEPKFHLEDPQWQLAIVTAVFGAGLAWLGAGLRGQLERSGRYLDPSQVSPAELGGMASSLVLLGSLWLPWYSTSDNSNSVIDSSGTGPNSDASAWEVFAIFDWLLLSACAAPFILTWIIMRRHALSWSPGEVTMIVGITCFILILCNGVILGKPEPGIEISLSYGWFVGLLATVGLLVSGYLRQAVYTKARKPPGTV